MDLRDIFLKKTKSQLEDLSKLHTQTISADENFLGASNLHRCIIKILEQKNRKINRYSYYRYKKNTSMLSVNIIVSRKEKVVLNNPYFINIKNEEIKKNY